MASQGESDEESDRLPLPDAEAPGDLKTSQYKRAAGC